MAIVEEIIIEGDASAAEEAFRKAAAASQQAADKMRSHSERVSQAWQRIEQKRAQDALAEVRRMDEADNLQKRLRAKYGETALAIGAVGLAMQAVSVALENQMKIWAAAAPDINTTTEALNGTRLALLGIKEAMAEESWVKRIPLFFATLANGDLWDNVAAGNASNAAARRREEGTAAMMAAIEAEAAGSGVGSDANSRAMADQLAKINANKRKRDEATAASAPMFDMAAIGMTGMEGLIEQEEAAAKSRAEIILDLEQRIADGKEEIRAANLDREIEASNGLIEITEESAKEREKIAKEEAEITQATYSRMSNMVGSVLGNMAETAVDALFAMAEGQSVNLAHMADEFLKGQGRQLVSSGIRYALEGGAMALMGNPEGAALAAQGGVMIGAGTAMMAGSLLIDNEGGGGGPGFASGGGSSDFAAGSGRSDRSSNSPDFQDRTVVVNVSGVITSKDVGRELKKAIDDANRKYS